MGGYAAQNENSFELKWILNQDLLENDKIKVVRHPDDAQLFIDEMMP